MQHSSTDSHYGLVKKQWSENDKKRKTIIDYRLFAYWDLWNDIFFFIWDYSVTTKEKDCRQNKYVGIGFKWGKNHRKVIQCVLKYIHFDCLNKKNCKQNEKRRITTFISHTLVRTWTSHDAYNSEEKVINLIISYRFL